MRWTCPKCGKKLEISNERLIANDGVIVCPQCLLQAQQPIPKARATSRSTAPSSPPTGRTSVLKHRPNTHAAPHHPINHA